MWQSYTLDHIGVPNKVARDCIGFDGASYAEGSWDMLLK